MSKKTMILSLLCFLLIVAGAITFSVLRSDKEISLDTIPEKESSGIISGETLPSLFANGSEKVTYDFIAGDSVYNSTLLGISFPVGKDNIKLYKPSEYLVEYVFALDNGVYANVLVDLRNASEEGEDLSLRAETIQSILSTNTLPIGYKTYYRDSSTYDGAFITNKEDFINILPSQFVLFEEGGDQTDLYLNSLYVTKIKEYTLAIDFVFPSVITIEEAEATLTEFLEGIRSLDFDMKEAFRKNGFLIPSLLVSQSSGENEWVGVRGELLDGISLSFVSGLPENEEDLDQNLLTSNGEIYTLYDMEGCSLYVKSSEDNATEYMKISGSIYRVPDMVRVATIALD